MSDPSTEKLLQEADALLAEGREALRRDTEEMDALIDATDTMLGIMERHDARETDTAKAEMDRMNAEMEEIMRKTEDAVRRSRFPGGE